MRGLVTGFETGGTAAAGFVTGYFAVGASSASFVTGAAGRVTVAVVSEASDVGASDGGAAGAGSAGAGAAAGCASFTGEFLTT